MWGGGIKDVLALQFVSCMYNFWDYYGHKNAFSTADTLQYFCVFATFVSISVSYFVTKL